jgi:hypothetical protein
MIFSNKDDASSVEKKVNPLAPAFSYPKVKHQGKSFYTQDASYYDNTPDTELDDDFIEDEPTPDLKVEPPSLNISAENLELFIKPNVQHSPVFVLEDESDEDPEPIQPLFLQDDNPTFKQESSFSDAYSIETKTDFPAVSQEVDSFSLDDAIAKLVGLETDATPDLPDEMPPKALSEIPPHFSSETLSQSGYEVPFSVLNTSIESDVEPTYETVLTQDAESTFAQIGYENDPLTTPHVAKPAPEKLPPKEERSFQDRTLAFEDDEHYYNPLAIGEVLPSYNLAETPVETLHKTPIETTTLDVFEDLHDADIDLQESFAVAQKSTEALETIFGANLVTPAVVEAPPLVNDAIEKAPFVGQASGVEAFELEEVGPQESLLNSPEEEIPFAYSALEESPSLNELPPHEPLVLPSLTPLPEAHANENPFDFSLFLEDNPEANSPIVFQHSTDEELAFMPSQAFLPSEEADVSTEIFEPVEYLDFPTENQWTVEDDDDLHLNVEPFVLLEEEPNVLLEEESVAKSSEGQAELGTTDFEVVYNKDVDQEVPADSSPNDLSIGIISEDDDNEEEDLFETLPPEVRSQDVTTSPGLSFQDFRQLEEGDQGVNTPNDFESNHFSIESEDALEDPNAFVDPSLFFSLEGLEDGTAPEAISLDLEPALDLKIPDSTSPFDEQRVSNNLVPPTKQNDFTHQLIHPVETEPLEAFDAFAEVSKASEATLGECATLALEDLEVLVSQPFPYGESHLYLVHVNSVYAIIALKHHYYTLLQAFSSLPEGVELIGSAEAPQIQGDTLQLTWNASSYNEHIFDLQFGSWHALIVEDAKGINVLK